MKSAEQDRIMTMVGDDKACYVVLSCREPDDDGRMEVEMTYEGDPVLAAYLLQSALGQIEQQLESDPELTGLDY